MGRRTRENLKKYLCDFCALTCIKVERSQHVLELQLWESLPTGTELPKSKTHCRDGRTIAHLAQMESVEPKRGGEGDADEQEGHSGTATAQEGQPSSAGAARFGPFDQHSSRRSHRESREKDSNGTRLLLPFFLRAADWLWVEPIKEVAWVRGRRWVELSIEHWSGPKLVNPPAGAKSRVGRGNSICGRMRRGVMPGEIKTDFALQLGNPRERKGFSRQIWWKSVNQKGLWRLFCTGPIVICFQSLDGPCFTLHARLFPFPTLPLNYLVPHLPKASKNSQVAGTRQKSRALQIFPYRGKMMLSVF